MINLFYETPTIKHFFSLQYLYVISWHGVYLGGDDAVEVYIDTADVLYAAQHSFHAGELASQDAASPAYVVESIAKLHQSDMLLHLFHHEDKTLHGSIIDNDNPPCFVLLEVSHVSTQIFPRNICHKPEITARIVIMFQLRYPVFAAVYENKITDF